MATWNDVEIGLAGNGGGGVGGDGERGLAAEFGGMSLNEFGVPER